MMSHFTTRRSIANIGVVIDESTQLLYYGPEDTSLTCHMRETTNGIYDALLRGRFAFDFVPKIASIRNTSASTVRCCCRISPCLATGNASRFGTTCDPVDRLWPALNWPL